MVHILVARVDGGSEKYISRLLIKWDNKGRIESRKNIEEEVVTCILTGSKGFICRLDVGKVCCYVNLDGVALYLINFDIDV